MNAPMTQIEKFDSDDIYRPITEHECVFGAYVSFRLNGGEFSEVQDKYNALLESDLTQQIDLDIVFEVDWNVVLGNVLIPIDTKVMVHILKNTFKIQFTQSKILSEATTLERAMDNFRLRIKIPEDLIYNINHSIALAATNFVCSQMPDYVLSCDKFEKCRQSAITDIISYLSQEPTVSMCTQEFVANAQKHALELKIDKPSEDTATGPVFKI